MKEFNGTIQEFLDEIEFKGGKTGILKKPKGRKFLELYWEKYDNNYDKWFLEIKESFMNKSDVCMIIRTNAINYISYYINLYGMKMYIK